MDFSSLSLSTITDQIISGFHIWGPRLLRVILIIVGLVLLRSFAQAAVRRFIHDSSTVHNRASKRAQTLAIISKSIINTALLALGITWILSELGINLGPILAAAGVLGLAIGFGAQSLVKDVLNGFFLILEGQVRVGDWIQTKENYRGQVEEITMRTIVLRDIDGNVHIVPHGEISYVINMTKSWSLCKVEIGVAYREDADHVIQVLTEEAEKLRKDNSVGAYIMEAAEIQGITEFGDSAVVYRVRIKTQTGYQWAVQRMYHLYLKRRFDADGIEIPFPHITLYMGEDKKGMAPPLRITKTQKPELERSAES